MTTNSDPNSGVPNPTKRKLASLSGNLCANPNCRKILVDDEKTDIGEIAHIAGNKKGSARFDPNMSQEQRNDINNLILLCANCHTKIDSDKKGKQYSIELLTNWKNKHEATVQQLLSEGFDKLNFPELEIATNWLLEHSDLAINDTNAASFSLTAIENKITKHKLSKNSRYIISQACSRQDSVEKFIQNRTQEDSKLPEKLKIRIFYEYNQFQKQGLSNDDLFISMCTFVKKVSTEFSLQSAAIAILVYFFEKCDIFSD
jgi:hypothetical protein